MQVTADFFQQASKVLTVSELTRSICLCEGRETSLDISEEIELVLIRVY
jgi:hypothetical protein